MKIIKLILITILLLPNNCFSQSLFGKVFGAKDYDECILLRIDSNTNAVAAKLIQKSCRNKFPKTSIPIKKEDKPQKIPDHIVRENSKMRGQLFFNDTNESDDEIHVTLINKAQGWWIKTVTIEIKFNEDGQDETIELTSSTVYCRYQEKCKFDFYPGIRWGIRKNYKSWWVVKLMGKRI
ncbi:uncharacterized protein METZ01_LOCUS295794, partial [marine metagenome]